MKTLSLLIGTIISIFCGILGAIVVFMLLATCTLILPIITLLVIPWAYTKGSITISGIERLTAKINKQVKDIEKKRDQVDENKPDITNTN